MYSRVLTVFSHGHSKIVLVICRARFITVVLFITRGTKLRCHRFLVSDTFSYSIIQVDSMAAGAPNPVPLPSWADLQEVSDRDLVNFCLCGNDDAFAVIVDRYQRL